MSVRNTIKRLAKTLFISLTLPLYIVYKLFSLFGDQDSIFQSFSQSISLIPGKIGSYIRASFYHLAFPNTSDDIVVGFLTVFSHRDTSIHRGCISVHNVI